MPTLQANGVQLYYEEHGQGENKPALVLAHGMGGNHAIWFKQLHDLRQHFHLITFDHRGFGNSTDPEGLGRSAYVADLKAILDQLQLEQVNLLGQSMGGGTCISFSCEYPERVSALVIADSLHALEESPELAELMDAARKATEGLGQIERVLGLRIRQEDPVAAVLYQQINSFNSVDRHSLKGVFRRFTLEQLRATAIPVFFIWGVEDVLFPIEAVRLVHRQLPDSQLVEIANTGHSAFYESPEAFNSAVVTALL